MALANVALTDTFDTWRIRTNQLIVATEQASGAVLAAYAASDAANAAFSKANSANVLAFVSFNHANASFDKANAANVLAYNTGIYANNSFYTIANGTAAFDTANAANVLAYDALPKTGGTVTGNITFSGDTITFTSNIASQTLTDSATINWNLSNGTVATITLGGNRTLANPTNKRVGSYILHIYQDGTGSRTLSFGADYKWPAGVAPPLSTSGYAHDVFSFICDGTYMYGSFLPDVK